MSDLFGNHIVGFPTRRLIYGAESPRLLTGQFSLNRFTSIVETLSTFRPSWSSCDSIKMVDERGKKH